MVSVGCIKVAVNFCVLGFRGCSGKMLVLDKGEIKRANFRKIVIGRTSMCTVYMNKAI